jgi:hypothetical protein
MIFKLTTPVALIIFNRPDFTFKIFDVVSKAKPTKLLITSDGARPDKVGESEKVDLARSIVSKVDWDCEVLTNFSPLNQGCKYGPARGIDWVFDQVEEAIILEDDCLPSLSFFRFCQELLDFYRDDHHVAMIAGSNLLPGSFKGGEESYFFSRHTFCWGWATWRDRWVGTFDVEIKNWPIHRDTNLFDRIHGSKKRAASWRIGFDYLYQNKMDAWDYQWLYANWLENRLTIVPRKNLVSNIGFGAEATHTFNSKDRLSNVPRVDIKFPLVHQKRVECNEIADKALYKRVFGPRPIDFLRAGWTGFKKFLKIFSPMRRLAKYLRERNNAKLE